MSPPACAQPPAADTSIRARIDAARARAEGFVWGVLHIQHPATREAATATAFAAAYAERVTEFLSGKREFVPDLATAWFAWRASGDLAADMAPVAAAVARVPDFQDYDAALRDPTARWLCAEALGYVRGWCDAAGVGSGDAVDFAHAYAVAVAAGGSRPNIADAWTNWRHGRPVTAFGEGVLDAVTGRRDLP